MTGPWFARLPLTTSTLQHPARVDRPCAVNEKVFVKSAGCGVFPHRAGIRFSVAHDGITAIEQAGRIGLARRFT
jgi:hypothetical protein